MSTSIAVIIPAYNAEKTIGASIRSVLGQTDPPEEIIVVDDGSTDGTFSVVEEFSPRVKLLRQDNQGAAMARQVGTIASTAEYIVYLDADDWWPEYKIARCRDIIAVEDVAFMLADLRRARPGDPPESYSPLNSSYYPWMKEYFQGQAAIPGVQNLYRLEPEDGLSLLLRGYPVNPPTMLVKRHVVDMVGGWDVRFRRSQDFDIGLRIARRYPLHYLDEVQAIVGIHDLNESVFPYMVKQGKGNIQVLSAHLEAEPFGSVYHRQVEEALGRRYYDIGYVYLKSGNKKDARSAYLKAMGFPGLRMRAFLRMALSFATNKAY